MSTAINIILIFLIALLTLSNLVWMAGLLALLFTFRVGALPLVVLAFAIDGYFGAFVHVPMFSLAACVWYVVSEIIRPKLLVQSGNYEQAS